MKIKNALIMLMLAPAASLAQVVVDYTIQGVPFNKVSINDQFWLPKIENNRTVTIPSSFKKCEETGRVENFILAHKKTGKFLTTFTFDDTDIYKTIEGASYSLSVRPDPALNKYVDSLITIVGQAQEPDGYLYTARTIDPAHPHKWSGNERWVLESELSHELYNSGHLFEAAAAHYMATGKTSFLNIALKNADLLVSVFGHGKRGVAPGHEIVEMGLVRLYRITKEPKYLELAKFFIDCRGKNIDPKPENAIYNQRYFQDHVPFIQQDEAVGHAVRAGYLYSGVADVAALTGNLDYINAIDKIWNNVVSKKMYITGGLGAIHEGERFGENYELPNLTAYNETCAAIANVYWNYRMFLLHGDAKYIDVMERSLYNNVIAGVALDGKTFFYANPLECDGKFKFNSGGNLDRQPWFDCSCCPTNLCRFLPSVPGYIYAQKPNTIFVNLFVASHSELNLNPKTSVELSQKTNYPWDGNVTITVNPSKKAKFSVCLRIPGWAMNKPVPGDLYSYVNPVTETVTLKVNGKNFNFRTEKGYAVIDREWGKGDVIEYVLPFTVHRVETNAKVATNQNKVALELGPIVYCLEAVDNKNMIRNMIIPDDAVLSANFEANNANNLSGIALITGEGIVFTTMADGQSINSQKQPLKAIPYYTWCNRGITEMNVWLPRKVTQIDLK